MVEHDLMDVQHKFHCSVKYELHFHYVDSKEGQVDQDQGLFQTYQLGQECLHMQDLVNNSQIKACVAEKGGAGKYTKNRLGYLASLI